MKYTELIQAAIDREILTIAQEKYREGIERGRAEERAEHAAQRDEKDAKIAHLTARVATLEAVLKRALLLDPTCEHGTLRRCGAIWTFCEDCGKQWSDDEGGYKPHSSNTIIAEIEAILSTSPAVSLNRIKAAELREAATHCEETELLMPIPEPRTTLRQHGANVCMALAKELRSKAERLEAEATDERKD